MALYKYIKPICLTALIFEIVMVMTRFWMELCPLQVVLFSEKVLITLVALNENLHKLSIEENKKGIFYSKYGFFMCITKIM